MAHINPNFNIQLNWLPGCGPVVLLDEKAWMRTPRNGEKAEKKTAPRSVAHFVQEASTSNQPLVLCFYAHFLEICCDVSQLLHEVKKAKPEVEVLLVNLEGKADAELHHRVAFGPEGMEDPPCPSSSCSKGDSKISMKLKIGDPERDRLHCDWCKKDQINGFFCPNGHTLCEQCRKVLSTKVLHGYCKLDPVVGLAPLLSFDIRTVPYVVVVRGSIVTKVPIVNDLTRWRADLEAQLG